MRQCCHPHLPNGPLPNLLDEAELLELYPPVERRARLLEQRLLARGLQQNLAAEVSVLSASLWRRRHSVEWGCGARSMTYAQV